MKNMFSDMHELIDTILQVRFTDLEKERECCEALLKLAKECNSEYAKAFAYTYLGDYYLALNDTTQSGKYLYEARQMCSKDTYPALYMKACHLSGFLYDIINDEQNSLHYYLLSISMAEELGDALQICNAWNNIANIYQRHHQLEEAKRYYLKAYQVMSDKNFNDKRLLIILLFNLAEIHGKLNLLDDMKKYIALCGVISSKEQEAFHKFSYQTVQFLYLAFQKQKHAASKIAKEILDTHFYEVEDRYIVIEYAITITQTLIQLKDNALSKRYIDVLQGFYTVDELQFTQRYIDLKVRFAEAFCDEKEVNQCCREYYFEMRKINRLEDEIRVDGMNAKIYLHDIIREHESMKKENERLEEEVKIDELTGLLNRRSFHQQLENVSGKSKGFGILMIDIDYFKEYNDTYGHIHGDIVLREVSDILKAHEKENLIAHRFGGDEFTCICNCMEEKEIQEYIHLVQKDLMHLKREHKNSKCSQQITLSIGYQYVEKDLVMDAYEVLNQADKALYQAKSNGRNTWKAYLR